MAKPTAKLTATQKSKIESCVKSRKKNDGRKTPTGSDYAVCTASVKKGRKRK